MNAFESLCKLASDENWCWKLYCTTCGHLHFRYAFIELANGKSPQSDSWIIHQRETRYSDTLRPLPRSFTEEQKKAMLDICSRADIASIAGYCRFPDWLGYLGLVLDHMRTGYDAYRTLSTSWDRQLSNLVLADRKIHQRLEVIAEDKGLLTLDDLEACEATIIQNNINNV